MTRKTENVLIYTRRGHFLVGKGREESEFIRRTSGVFGEKISRNVNFTYLPLILTQTVLLRSVYILWPKNAPSSFLEVITLNTPPLHFIFIIPILGTIKWKQRAVAMKQIMRGSDRDRSLKAG